MSTRPGPPPGRRRPRSAGGRGRVAAEILADEYPGGPVELCELAHTNPFELLVATILSAQCTDERVNATTPAVFARWPDAHALAAADPAELEEAVHPTGFYRQKAGSLLKASAALVERHDGEVPEELDDLVALPGVGRKTANVVRSVAFDRPGLPVDTHVGRVAVRLGLTEATDPVAVEHEIGAMVPAADRGRFALRLILHGRRVCTARRPACGECALAWFCPGFDPGRGGPSVPRRKKSREIS